MATWPTTALVDDFNRASMGANWTAYSGSGLTIIANEVAAPTTGGHGSRYATEVGPDVHALLTVAARQPDRPFLFALYKTGGTVDGYRWVIYPGGTTSIEKRVAGTNTSLTSFATTYLAGDVIGIYKEGATLRLYRKPVATGVWGQLGTDVTDSTFELDTFRLHLYTENEINRGDDLHLATVNALAPPAPPGGTGFDGAAFLDDFNRATGLGANWISPSGNPLTIVSNQLAAGTTGQRQSGWAQTYGPAASVFFDIPTVGAAADTVEAKLLASDSPEAGYIAQITYGSPSTTTLYRYNAPTLVTLASTTAAAWGAGDSLALRMIGEKLTVWRKPSGGDYAQILDATDTTYQATLKRPAVLIKNNTARIDNFGAASYVSVPAIREVSHGNGRRLAVRL